MARVTVMGVKQPSGVHFPGFGLPGIFPSRDSFASSAPLPIMFYSFCRKTGSGEAGETQLGEATQVGFLNWL